MTQRQGIVGEKVILFAYDKGQGVTEHLCNMALSISGHADLLVVYDKRIEPGETNLNKLRSHNIECVDIAQLAEVVNSRYKDQPVLFHCNGFAHLRLARKMARPIDKIILSVHCFRHALWYAKFVAIATYLLFWCRVDLWHFLSHKSREEYFWFRGVPGNTCVFPLGVEELFMTKTADSAVIWDSSSGKIANFSTGINIVCIARFQPWKRHTFLLESLQPILSGNINLILVGEGPIRSKIENLAKKLGIRENVIFTGTVDRKTVHSILCRANLAVTVSPSETFGWCVLEPFCMDVPVVTTDVGIASVVIGDYRNGFILNPNCTREEFLEKVKMTLKCLGKVGNSPAKEFYRWEAFGNNIANCYNSIC